MNKQIAAIAISTAMLMTAGTAHASETIAYTYDAKGRVVQVVHSGTVNNGVTTQYNHDHADNRTKVKTTGAP